MPDSYNRPEPPNPFLPGNAGAVPPGVTSERQYQMSQGAEDLVSNKPISVFGRSVAPPTQTVLSSAWNLFAQVADFLETLGAIKELQSDARSGQILMQVQQQLQPGQGVQVVISDSPDGHLGIQILAPTTLGLESKESQESGSVKALMVEKPGPGDLQCLVPSESTPVTTVFHLSVPEKTTVEMDTSQLRENEKPVEQARMPSPTPEQSDRSREDDKKIIVLP